MTRRNALIAFAVVALLAAAGAWYGFARQAGSGDGAVIEGSDRGRLPRADAGQEGFDERALQGAAALVRERGASALLVVRHGHLVLEQYARGADADSLFEGGELARAVPRLAAGVAADRYGMAIPDTLQVDERRLASAIATASGQAYPQFLSRHLWRPLGAAAARWLDPGMRARAADWMRVAALLLHDGRFEGTQVVPPGWVARLGVPRAPSGAEPFRAGEVIVFRGSGTLMVWLAPRPDLLVLCVDATPAPGVTVDETRLPRMVLRALREEPSSSGTRLEDLVPGH